MSAAVGSFLREKNTNMFQKLYYIGNKKRSEVVIRRLDLRERSLKMIIGFSIAVAGTREGTTLTDISATKASEK